jgi:hypothetical protein
MPKILSREGGRERKSEGRGDQVTICWAALKVDLADRSALIPVRVERIKRQYFSSSKIPSLDGPNNS